MSLYVLLRIEVAGSDWHDDIGKLFVGDWAEFAGAQLVVEGKYDVVAFDDFDGV